MAEEDVQAILDLFDGFIERASGGDGVEVLADDGSEGSILCWGPAVSVPRLEAEALGIDELAPLVGGSLRDVAVG